LDSLIIFQFKFFFFAGDEFQRAVGVVEIVAPFAAVAFEARLQVFLVVVDPLYLRVRPFIDVDVELEFE
jgi:hypothetical protein